MRHPYSVRDYGAPIPIAPRMSHAMSSKEATSHPSGGTTDDSMTRWEATKGGGAGRVISTVSTRAWMNGSSHKVIPAKKGGKSRSVIYPIFLLYSRYTDDLFWEEKLREAATGKFPRSFSRGKSGALVYKRGSKVQHVELPTDPVVGAVEFINFMQTHGGIFSESDKKRLEMRRQERAEEAMAAPPLTWSSPRLKKMSRICLILQFCEDVAESMGLTRGQKKQLQFLIDSAISTKAISPPMVEMDDNRISTIRGILYDAHTGVFSLHESLMQRRYHVPSRLEYVDPQRRDRSMVPNYGKRWEKLTKEGKTKKSKKDTTSTLLVIDPNSSISHMPAWSNSSISPNYQ